MLKIWDGEEHHLVHAKLLPANLRDKRRCISAIPLNEEELDTEEKLRINGQLSMKVMNDTAEPVFGRRTQLNVEYGMNMESEGPGGNK